MTPVPTKRSGVALISVSDKRQIEEMAEALVKLGFKILSTGGTAAALKKAGVAVTEVSEWTGFPEIMDGRVKTLHPKIHGGLLGRRNVSAHAAAAREHAIAWIDLVIVNLYPFEKTVSDPGVKLEEAVENIDIGGPSMIRSAAKNFEYVTVLVDPKDYKGVLEELLIKGETSPATRRRLAAKAFGLTARYDAAIDTFLSERLLNRKKLHLSFEEGESLRYGENDHQSAVFYKSPLRETSVAHAKQLHGKALSYNNIVDADAALDAVMEVGGAKAVAIVKHTNPCGLATGPSLAEAFEAAWSGDIVSAFGSVIAVNTEVDLKTARCLEKRFVEILLAPRFHPEALEFLKAKSKDLRLLEVGDLTPAPPGALAFRHVRGGMLEQDRDGVLFQKFDSVTRAAFPDQKKKLAEFAYAACKHIKSNAIVLAHEYRPGFYMVLGMGAGQPNRVDALRKLSAVKAAENLERMHGEQKSTAPLAEFKARALAECVLASDAFFPFSDSIQMAAELGVRYIVEPGGSKRDDEVIAACDQHNIAMVFTGTRHFKH